MLKLARRDGLGLPSPESEWADCSRAEMPLQPLAARDHQHLAVQLNNQVFVRLLDAKDAEFIAEVVGSSWEPSAMTLLVRYV